ncbi:hypothetical protein QVD17_09006 [Tagetes erecta]|uniref:Uncharacterized protein n=1 Tax=Tagetes erecta TaxID=13708 RepID=A0AAD8L6G8_TARER|nr:hypothetical protein QVD17_09006 [Tagetes erecta]
MNEHKAFYSKTADVHYLAHGRAPGRAGSYSVFFFAQAFRSFHFQQNLDSRYETYAARAEDDLGNDLSTVVLGLRTGVLGPESRARPCALPVLPSGEHGHDRARSEHGRAFDLFSSISLENASFLRSFLRWFVLAVKSQKPQFST